MIFVDCVQGTPEWFAARCGVTTASTFSVAVEVTGGLDEKQQAYVDAVKGGMDMKAALLAAGYKSAPRAAVVERALAGLPVTEPSPANVKLAVGTAIELVSGQPFGDTFETYAMRHGREQEAMARWHYEARTRQMVEEAGIALTDDRAFGYSSDGFIGDDGGIEIKCPRDPAKIVKILETGDISEYIHQIQGGLWLTGRRWMDFVMYVPELAVVGRDLYIKRVERDEDFIETMELGLVAHRRLVHHYERVLRAQPQPAAAAQPELLAA